jgi:hypothetical protein
MTPHRSQRRALDSTHLPLRPPAFDPVHTLPPELFAFVVNYSEPTDTEILRRVSRNWKTASEYHVSTAWIARKHPELQLRDEFKDSKTANLTYRRHCM